MRLLFGSSEALSAEVGTVGRVGQRPVHLREGHLDSKVGILFRIETPPCRGEIAANKRLTDMPDKPQVTGTEA